MKKSLLSLVLLLSATAVSAQLANGYYRVQNFYTERFIQVIDNHGHLDKVKQKFDLNAVQTVKPFETVADDPATIIYVEYLGTKNDNGDYEYNLKTQGTSTYDITEGLKVALKPQGNTYLAYGKASRAGITMTAYLCDPKVKSLKKGVMDHVPASEIDASCNWYAHALSQEDERYFGVKPEFSSDGVYYTSIYAAFPFDFYSPGMKAYKVVKVDGNMAVYVEVTGTVPASTPVIISCSSADVASNRLTLKENSAAAPSSNMLRGVYFSNPVIQSDGSRGIHDNAVPYDAKTMRVLGLTSDGKPGFVKYTGDQGDERFVSSNSAYKGQYLPRNHAYLVVPAGSPDELVLVSEAEYEAELEKVTITAKSYSRQYGEANPAFEYTVTDGKIKSGTPTLTCEATATSPVGTYDIVVGQGTVTNTAATLVNGKLTVTQTPLTVTARSYTIKQNEPLPQFAVDYQGFKNGETESVLTAKPTVSSNAPADKKPGTYQLTPAGAAAQNYSISYVPGTLTITEADPITVTIQAKQMVYGDEVPQLTYEVSGGTLPSEPKLSCPATKTSDVGQYDITADVSGIDYPNIKVVAAKLTITKAPVTVTAKSYEIDDAALQLPDFEATYEGWRNGQDESVLTKQPTFNCGAVNSGIAPGNYTIYVYGADAKNYSFTYENGQLTITRAPNITVRAEAKQMTYGGEVPELTYVVEGGTLTGEPVLTCGAGDRPDAGEYTIAVAQGTVVYPHLVLVDAKLTVEKAQLTVSAGNYTMKQTDEMPEFKATYSGFCYDDDEQVLTAKPVFATTAPEDQAPGTYEVTVSGADAKNYSFSYVPGVLVISEADQIIIMAEAKQMTYGDELPQLTYTVSGGEIEGEPLLTCEATSQSDCGVYAIKVEAGTVDYPNLLFVNAQLTINKALLTVKVGNYEREEGDENPEFELVYEGFRNDDTVEVLSELPVATTEATVDSPAGEYAIVVEGGEALNYEFAYVNGVLKVNVRNAIMAVVYSSPVDVYTLTGRKVRSQVTSLAGLPRGVYIVNGQKVIVRR